MHDGEYLRMVKQAGATTEVAELRKWLKKTRIKKRVGMKSGGANKMLKGNQMERSSLWDEAKIREDKIAMAERVAMATKISFDRFEQNTQ